MKYVCRLGCTEPDGSAKVHAARRFCPYESAFRRQHGRWMGPGDAGGANIQATRTAVRPDAAPTGPGAAPDRAAPAKAGKGFSVSYRPTAVVGPGVELAAAGQVSAEWEVSQETCEKFWQTVISGIEQLLDFLCEVLLQIPKVPSEVFQLDEGQKYVIRTTFRGFTTNILQKVFRAKTPEDADRIVAGIGGIVGFGLMALKIVWHFIKEVPKSPRLAKIRERIAEIRARREAERMAQRQAAGENVKIPELPAAPAIGALANGG